MDYCEEVVAWIQDVINWLIDIANWLNGQWWLFGAQNWAINEINSLIHDLRSWQQWISKNCEEIDEIEAVINWIIDIIEWADWLIGLF